MHSLYLKSPYALTQDMRLDQDSGVDEKEAVEKKADEVQI